MILIEEGIVGIGALLIGMVLLVRWWWRLGANSDSFFVGLVLGAFLIFSNLEYPLWYLNFLVIFLIFCGLAAPAVEKPIDSAWVKPSLAIVTLVVGGLIAINFARGFYQVSSVQANRNLNNGNLTTLSLWAMNRMVEPFVVLVLERYTVPHPDHMGRQMRLAEKEIHRLPMPKALLDKTMLLEFAGKQEKACALAERTAYSYPHVLDLYADELTQYASRKKPLPGNPLALNKCFEKGYAQWKKQWTN